MCVCVCVCVGVREREKPHMCVCVCVCERERERDREREKSQFAYILKQSIKCIVLFNYPVFIFNCHYCMRNTKTKCWQIRNFNHWWKLIKKKKKKKRDIGGISGVRDDFSTKLSHWQILPNTIRPDIVVLIALFFSNINSFGCRVLIFVHLDDHANFLWFECVTLFIANF